MPDISHAIVLPEENFEAWLQAIAPYRQAFERVAVVRSPRGNDLNRYRTVTAIAAPRTWLQDDPLAHIRRIYPMVVRVDVIDVQTPDDLRALLQERIVQQDRFGALLRNVRARLLSRFVLEWPTSARPIRIVRSFHDAPGVVPADNPGVDIFTRPGASVLAAVPGMVTRIWESTTPDETFNLARYVQVSTTIDEDVFIVTYAGVRDMDVTLGQRVEAGEQLGVSVGDSLQVIVQNPPHGKGDFSIPHVVDPTRLVYVQGLRVRPTANVTSGLRVRSTPVDGDVMGLVQRWDLVETMELHGRALQKIGQQGEWLRVKLPDGRTGFAAAWFLEAAVKGEQPKHQYSNVNPVGVNLDQLHPYGAPAADVLGPIGWVRFGYNVSNNQGLTDIRQAYDRYMPLIERYMKAGYKVIFTTSHQTYGEGRNEYFPWTTLNNDDRIHLWGDLINKFADMMGRIMRDYKGMDIVWQVWNEPDSVLGSEAAVPMLPHTYGQMLTQVIRAMRAEDPDVTVITAGLTGGPSNLKHMRDLGVQIRGSAYGEAALQNVPLDAQPDGIAFHPYGRSPRGQADPYGHFGHIDQSMQAYLALMPDKPVWITEWGVLKSPNENPRDIGEYAVAFIKHLKTHYAGRVAAMVWYAWAETMHNGYGLTLPVPGQPNVTTYRDGLTREYLEA